MSMPRSSIGLLLILPILAATACTSSSTPARNSTVGAALYRNNSGWTVIYPRGWHLIRFQASKGDASSAGVQLSNVTLPKPALIPGYPIQVNGQVLPKHGIGLIIATDSDPKISRGPYVAPPLRYPQGWSTGSAPGGAPYMDTIWFRVHGTPFIACAKIGPGAAKSDLSTLAKIIRSLRIVKATAH